MDRTLAEPGTCWTRGWVNPVPVGHKARVNPVPVVQEVGRTHNPLDRTLGEPGTCWIGGWVNQRAGLDAVAKKALKIIICFS